MKTKTSGGLTFSFKSSLETAVTSSAGGLVVSAGFENLVDCWRTSGFDGSVVEEVWTGFDSLDTETVDFGVSAASGEAETSRGGGGGRIFFSSASGDLITSFLI